MIQRNLLLAAAAIACTCAAAQTSPYAGEQSRDIKALSPGEVRELMAGAGMGLARAAELNGYPGPAHVLEHADALALTPQQRQATEALREQHRTRAQKLGAALVEAERNLDQAFARRQVDEALLAKLTADIGSLQGQLRAEHLRTHLAQTALLSRHQVHEYTRLRGYADGAAPAHAPAPGHRH